MIVKKYFNDINIKGEPKMQREKQKQRILFTNDVFICAFEVIN